MINPLKKILGGIRHYSFITADRIREFIFEDLRTVMKNFGSHDGELSSCALAFFLLISFIPASLVIISIVSYFYGSDTIASLYIDQIRYQLPTMNLEDLIGKLDSIVYKKRYLAFIWIPFLFWWGSFVFDIIERMLEKAFRIEESRKYWKAKIRHFILIVGMAFFILLLTLMSNLFAVVRNIDITQYMQQRLNAIQFLYRLVTYIAETPLIIPSVTTLVFNALFIFIIYKFIPPKKLSNRALIKGALFASFSYEVVKFLFSFYISEINDYSSIFGSFNVIVILMIWIWYTCFLFIIGAELAWVFHERSQVRKLSFEQENS